jgi:succinate dehydrogenase / fumarate reductase, cytochrome b subunit
MSVTGVMLVGFITVHMLGNMSIFFGQEAINSYAHHLHSLGPLVWIFRLVMLVLFAVHVTFGVQLSLENRTASPEAYAIKKKLKTTFAAESMFYTGLILLVFVIYHLLHFTLHVVHTDATAAVQTLVNGQSDVYTMVKLSFEKAFVSLVYAGAMFALFFHLSHGLSSWVQTLGWNNGTSQEKIIILGKLVAVVFLIGYVAIPFSFLFGMK